MELGANPYRNQAPRASLEPQPAGSSAPTSRRPLSHSTVRYVQPSQNIYSIEISIGYEVYLTYGLAPCLPGSRASLELASITYHTYVTAIAESDGPQLNNFKSRPTLAAAKIFQKTLAACNTACSIVRYHLLGLSSPSTRQIGFFDKNTEEKQANARPSHPRLRQSPMTARADTVNLIARMIATSQSKKFHDLPARERLALNELSNHIMAVVEKRMARVDPDLATDLKQQWILPA